VYAYAPNVWAWTDPLGLEHGNMPRKGAGVGGGKKLFPNQQPQNLAAELERANKLGVKPINPSDPGFEKIANSGRIKWAVTEDGELLVIPHSSKGIEISHATITKGKPVMAAGEADIAMFDGQAFGLDITTNSGHFLYGADAATNAAVKNIGIDAFSKFGIVFNK